MVKEKKEIGMEKLIELLNEYNCKVLKHTDKWKEKDGKLIMEIDYNHSRSFNTDLYIVSLRYGFIKWLVENDKIERDKCGFKNEGLSGNWYDSGIAFIQNYDNDTYKVSEFYSPYLQLLMLLSISDTPIEDLISYLK